MHSGADCYESTPASGTPLFTGQTRDPETSLGYFGARYFSGAQGRFSSPDRPFVDQHPENPQSWNLYAYAGNNPLKYVAPTSTAYCYYANGNTPKDGPATNEDACAEDGGTWILGAGDVQIVENESGDSATVDTPYTSVTVNGDTGESSGLSWYLVDGPMAPREHAHQDHGGQERW